MYQHFLFQKNEKFRWLFTLQKDPFNSPWPCFCSFPLFKADLCSKKLRGFVDFLPRFNPPWFCLCSFFPILSSQSRDSIERDILLSFLLYVFIPTGHRECRHPSNEKERKNGKRTKMKCRVKNILCEKAINFEERNSRMEVFVLPTFFFRNPEGIDWFEVSFCGVKYGNRMSGNSQGMSEYLHLNCIFSHIHLSLFLPISCTKISLSCL